jgi:DNA-binding NtrC family response regulator
MRLPPLRERGTDTILLAKAFLKEFAKENDKPIEDIHPDAVEALMNHPWPGNVRELRTALEHAVVLCRGNSITLRDLPPSVRGESAGSPHPAARDLFGKKNVTMEDAEKAVIIRALKECNGNRTQAAEKIGMSRRTLHRKLHTYNLHDL